MLCSLFQIKSSRWFMMCSYSQINDSQGLFYKSLGIPQRVTESQRAHISSHDGFSNFVASDMLNMGPKIYQSEGRVARIHLFFTKYYICQVISLLFSDQSLFTNEHLQVTIVSYEDCLIFGLIIQATLSLIQKIFVD